MWGSIPPPPSRPGPGHAYALLWLCDHCAGQRLKKHRSTHRCEETLLPEELRICRDCSEAQTCRAYRDYGRGS